ncbi:probable cytochrome P450 6a14 isoform X3 [Apis laboriosa]|uniref:probable cytochrome P450 6a14 isoform X3 n=1 Tax=Apis laboriosa TaxID=183418 RepID=UPI001CC6971C|nr:probable cytochrome P450 6a14 isoform X3 [Apis laboriosa]
MIYKKKMYISLEILCGIIIALIVFYYYLIINNNFWKNREISGPKPVIGFGNMLSIILGKESTSQFLTRIYNEYKNEPMIGIFSKNNPALIIKDPDLIKTVLIKDFHKFANRGLFPVNSREPLSQNLFGLEAERWRPLRIHFSPIFTTSKLKGLCSLILECSEQLEKYMDILIKKREPLDVREIAARFTTDVIGSCAFGIEMNSLSEKESEFRRLGKGLFTPTFRRIVKTRIRNLIPWLYNFFLRILPWDEITKKIVKLTSETIEYRKKNNIVRSDFINILLDLKRHPEKIAEIELTNDLLSAQTFVFFGAGFETSSTTISNALYELALNHDIQNKLREEIKEFEKKNDGKWTYENIKEMQYLEKIFQETLRKYPVVPFLNRELINDYTFENSKIIIPKGLKIWIPVYGIHHDPDIYPNPEKFDPERFSEDKIKKRHPMHYLPFGHGPRNCIGARFGTYQTKIGLIKIIHKYKVEICDKTLIPYKFNPYTHFLMPLTGLYLMITEIEN